VGDYSGLKAVISGEDFDSTSIEWPARSRLCQSPHLFTSSPPLIIVISNLTLINNTTQPDGVISKNEKHMMK